MFVIFSSGDGFEVLDPDVFYLQIAKLDPGTTTKDIYAVPPNQSVLPFPTPLGSHGYTLVTKHNVMDSKLVPLATSATAHPAQRKVDAHDPLGSLKRPSTFPSRTSSISENRSTLTLPRTIGHREHKPRESPKPILVFREVIELPQWREGSLDAICQLLQTFTEFQGERAGEPLVRSASFSTSVLVLPI